MDILNKGGKIYYKDTDSIITNKKLKSSIVGEKLGQFKLKHRISKGYFISNKTYGFITDTNKVIIKSKGGDSKSLSFSDF